MFRSLLIVFLGGLLAWLILRLVRTVREVMPGTGDESASATPPDEKIIDAEFEEIDNGEK